MVVGLVVYSQPGEVSAEARNDVLFGRLAEHVRREGVADDRARAIIMQSLAERDADSDDESLLIEALALMSEGFRTGLDAYDEEDYAACIAAMAKLDDDDPFLRHNARSYTAKALVHSDRLVEAQEKIAAILDDADALAAHSLDQAELVYMLGYCQLQNLAHDDAKLTLEGFLDDFPNASPRLTVTAKQMLAELARRIPRSIGEVADLMNFSQQRLLAGDPGERTRGAQDRVIELLDTLIDEVEKQENSAAQSGAQSGRNRPQRSQRRNIPQNPMPNSKTTPGAPSGGAKRPGRQVSPGEAWGAMPAAEREKILQVLRDRFPGRYRALVEQYYQSLAEQP